MERRFKIISKVILVAGLLGVSLSVSQATIHAQDARTLNANVYAGRYSTSEDYSLKGHSSGTSGSDMVVNYTTNTGDQVGKLLLRTRMENSNKDARSDTVLVRNNARSYIATRSAVKGYYYQAAVERQNWWDGEADVRNASWAADSQ